MNRLLITFWKSALCCWLMLFACGLQAQQVQDLPDGRFLEPETKVGAPIHYILKYKHKPMQEVLFPDSAYDFAPFELIDKQFFPTKTVGNTSIDSVVYTLATYETDTRQGLALPVFIASSTNPDGKRAVFPKADSIDLEPLIQAMPDSIRLFEDTQMAHVDKEFNYPYLLIAVGLIWLIIASIILFFGGTIRRSWKLRRLKKKHLQFVGNFERFISQGVKADVESAVALWKGYTGNLTSLPLASYTTKEISRNTNSTPEVIDALRYTDKVIYAGTSSEDDLTAHLQELKKYTQSIYQKEVQRIKGNQKAKPKYIREEA